MGGIDVLVNSAGFGGYEAGAGFDPEAWEAVLRIGLIDAFSVTRNAIPHLIRLGNGVIIGSACSQP